MKSICIHSSNLWEECAPALTLLTTVYDEENGLEICLYHIFYFSLILNLVYILQIFQWLLFFYWPFAFKSSWHWNFNNQVIFSSVQFSHSVVSDSLWPHELQHTRPSCPSPTPGVHSDSHPSSQWCHPAISSSVIPFSSCPQSLPASQSFPMSQLFAWGGQSTGA